ncbi:hypothetical protein [Tatumella saanichensis]|uniref:hypothetical protein n=1 Tax=Tatumella saanichensis TaxID=480813 RepID=UPI000685A138|nr:hypothetical protein [Tatumella saanichensis]
MAMALMNETAGQICHAISLGLKKVSIIFLTGSELKVFKNRVANSNAVGSNARTLTLWTEKGAARMSKIVDTNQAWDFFEKLEDSYFNLREVYGVILPNIDDPIQLGRG